MVERSARVIRFFERCLSHTKGTFAGKPFILLPWQRAIVEGIFDPCDDQGHRRVREAYVEVGKKNGKTEFAAGIALYMLLMDGEPGAEVYSAAMKREQAALIFRVCEGMIRLNKLLLDAVNIIPSSKTIVRKQDPTSFYKALSAEAGAEDGINPHCVVFDELHRQKTRDLWDVFDFGTDARAQPLLLSITTAGVEHESELCWEKHTQARQQIAGLTRDPTFYPVIHAADEKDDWTKEETWRKANPSMEGNPGGFIPVARIAQQCKQAQESPRKENSFRRFRLSQWVQQETRWLPMEDWDACGKPFNPDRLVGRTCYAGLDLSTSLDVTALVLAFGLTLEELGEDSDTPDKVVEAILPFFWLPGDGINERKPTSIGLWAKAGLIETTAGRLIDYTAIERKLTDLRDVYDIRELAYDRWGATDLITRLEKQDFTCVPIAQSYSGMSAPSKEFEARVIGHLIRHSGNPVMRWMADSVSVKQDPAGNIKPVKPDRQKHTKRVDGITATVLATDRLSRHQAGDTIDFSEALFA